jgi:hypothetical protein
MADEFVGLGSLQLYARYYVPNRSSGKTQKMLADVVPRQAVSDTWVETYLPKCPIFSSYELAHRTRLRREVLQHFPERDQPLTADIVDLQCPQEAATQFALDLFNGG